MNGMGDHVTTHTYDETWSIRFTNARVIGCRHPAPSAPVRSSLMTRTLMTKLHPPKKLSFRTKTSLLGAAHKLRYSTR